MIRKDIGLTRWGVCFERRNDTGLGNLVWSTIIHVYGSKKEDVTFLSDSRSNGFHYFAVDGLLVIRDKVLVQQLLDLVW